MKHDNVNRYAAFCQFRREICGSAEYVIVGIDVAKERHHAFFGTATGQALLKRLLFDNNAGGFRALFTRYLKAREKERGIRTKMRVKLAAKMLVIAWTMMRTETDFDPNLLAV